MHKLGMLRVKKTPTPDKFFPEMDHSKERDDKREGENVNGEHMISITKGGWDLFLYCILHIEDVASHPGQHPHCHSNVNTFNSKTTIHTILIEGSMDRSVHCCKMYIVCVNSWCFAYGEVKKMLYYILQILLLVTTFETFFHQDPHPPCDHQSIWGWDRCVMGGRATGCEFCREESEGEGEKPFQCNVV